MERWKIVLLSVCAVIVGALVVAGLVFGWGFFVAAAALLLFASLVKLPTWAPVSPQIDKAVKDFRDGR